MARYLTEADLLPLCFDDEVTENKIGEQLAVMADRMRLAAIKCADPYAKGIVDRSTYVTLYEFNSNKTEWEKTNIGGAFFVYSRYAKPFHGLSINSQWNANLWVEPITAGIDIQNESQFMMLNLNVRSSSIRGLWFNNQTECDRISNLVKTLTTKVDSLPIVQIGESNELSPQASCTVTAEPQEEPQARQNDNEVKHLIFSQLF